MACPGPLVAGVSAVALALGGVVLPGDVLEALESECPLLEEHVDLEGNRSTKVVREKVY